MRYLLLAVCVICTVTVHAQNRDTVAGEKIFHYVEGMPASGYSLHEYLSKNLHYPKSAKKSNIQGRVIIKFVVNEDGHISDCEVTSGIGRACDDEALRVVKKMPPWKPGTQNGKAVKVYFTLPIVFKLED